MYLEAIVVAKLLALASQILHLLGVHPDKVDRLSLVGGGNVRHVCSTETV
jgi:hypothetical protein